MVVETLSTWIVQTISFIGHPGLFILMALESTLAPVPSEIVMPFAGFLISEGRFTLLGVALTSTLGSVAGSLAGYALGMHGGHRIVKRYGKYLLVDENHLLRTEHWFKKHGEKTIFISRFLPVVRHLISIPAGIGKMNKKHFVFYTAAGALLWNSFLAYLGIILKNNWELVHQYSKPIDITLLALIVLATLTYTYLHLRRNHAEKKHPL